jgi:hypothetical protein
MSHLMTHFPKAHSISPHVHISPTEYKKVYNVNVTDKSLTMEGFTYFEAMVINQN